MSVTVFKTNIQKPIQAKNILDKLTYHYPEHRINFDLEDCDNILRIEGAPDELHVMKKIIHENGFICEILE